MKNKIKQLLYVTTDWTIEALVEVVTTIIRLVIWASKRLYRESKVKLTWKIAGTLTGIYFVLWVGLTGYYVVKHNFYTVYAKPVTKIYTPLEEQNYFLKRENKLLKGRLQDLEYLEIGLKNGDKKAVVEYIKIKFGEAWKIAVAVFTAESGLTCNRYQDWLNKDKSVDHGVAQINSVHLWRVNGDRNKLLECKTNLDVAYQIYKEQGFTPWVAYQNGAYEKFLSSL